MLWHCWGKGEPVLLLHGGSGSWLHWLTTIPLCAEDKAKILSGNARRLLKM